ncbi:MAG: ribosome-associated translation inhibitor RaiA [Candidatus Omnitrophota bacterium]|jgi:putative sigma-54 modulation protein
MDITITGRNVELTDSLKEYVQKRMSKLERLYGRINSCEVILEKAKIRQEAEVILHLKRTRIIAKESSPDIYASVDNAAENVKKQLRRLRGKLQTKRRKAMLNKLMSPVMRFREPEEGSADPRGRIVKANTFASKPMLPEEARMELDLSNGSFIAFKNADTGETNVLYKKSDGNYGLIEPSF